MPDQACEAPGLLFPFLNVCVVPIQFVPVVLDRRIQIVDMVANFELLYGGHTQSVLVCGARGKSLGSTYRIAAEQDLRRLPIASTLQQFIQNFLGEIDVHNLGTTRSGLGGADDLIGRPMKLDARRTHDAYRHCDCRRSSWTEDVRGGRSAVGICVRERCWHAPRTRPSEA